jgi:hypothetical protein
LWDFIMNTLAISRNITESLIFLTANLRLKIPQDLMVLWILILSVGFRNLMMMALNMNT